MEEGVLEDGQQDGEEVVPEDAGEDVEGRGRALAEVPVGQRAVVVAAALVVASLTLKVKTG
jgi:hypothetical protein